MATQHHRGHVLERYAKFFGNKCTEAGRIQHAGHTDNPILTELRNLVRRPAHGIQRIGNQNQDAIRRILHRLFGGGANHLVVGDQKIVAAHAGFARKSGGDNDDVGIRGGLVAIDARDADVIAFNGTGFQKVEGFPLGNPLHHIHQNHIGQFLLRNAEGAIGADIARAYNSDFFSHRPFRSILLARTVNYTALVRRVPVEQLLDKSATRLHQLPPTRPETKIDAPPFYIRNGEQVRNEFLAINQAFAERAMGAGFTGVIGARGLSADVETRGHCLPVFLGSVLPGAAHDAHVGVRAIEHDAEIEWQALPASC